MLGEGPLWVGHEQALYWVDIKAPAVHSYKPEGAVKTSWPMPEKIGCLVYRQGTGFLAALQSGFVRIEFGASGTTPLITAIANPEADLPGNRFNDGKLDAMGRFWAGTMDDAERETTGAWWQLDERNQVHEIDSGYKVTNGPAFDAARGRVYLTDSAAQTIYVARPGGDGCIENKQVFLRFGPVEGYPDGMTTDHEGNLWVAFWDGGCIRRITPEGNADREILMPVPRPTSLAFGADKDTLYVTSASIGLSAAALQAAPLSGGVFIVNMA